MAKSEESKLPEPIPQPEQLSQPVMTYGQLVEGRSLLQKFLKKIEIRIKGERVVVNYIWEFPDEIVAKTFAENMKSAFEGQLNPEEKK